MAATAARRLRPLTSSEGRHRRPALRRRHQRRRRAARPLCRRAPRPSRRGRGADDLRDRLHYLAQRIARRASRPSTASPCAGSRSRRERDPQRLRPLVRHASSTRPHSLADELSWLDAEGPTSPALVEHIASSAKQLRLLHLLQLPLLPLVPRPARRAAQAILVPTAERDSALGLALFPPVFRGVRALMYNSFEERALIHGVSDNQRCRASSSASARTFPSDPKCGRFRQKFGMRGPLRDLRRPHRREQGLQGAVRVLRALRVALVDGMHLVLIGNADVPVPEASADSPPRLSRRPGQVRRDGRRRNC